VAKTPVPLFRRPWWERDPEVAEFVRSLFGSLPIGDMPMAVATRFSPERAPAKSSIHRFMNVLRKRPIEKRRRGRRRGGG
jgi:hypothetical protein